MSTLGKRLVNLQKASDQQIVDAYKRFGSVWKAGEHLGMGGQTVHDRLKKIGIKVGRGWTQEQIDFLRDSYAMSPHGEPLDLANITSELNRKFGVDRLPSNVCRKAKELGLGTNQSRRISETRRMGIVERLCEAPRKNIHSGAANSGYREDIDMFVRSSWEANYVRYLNYKINIGDVVGYEYEKHKFKFLDVPNGPYIYIPDFKVLFSDGHYEWHEVKGWMDPKSQEKIRRFKEQYPTEVLVIIDVDVYSRINAIYSKLEGWESPTRKARV